MSSARKGRASTPSRSGRGRQQRARTPRLRILFLASQFPYPADSGAAIKTLSVIDYLRRSHDVRLVSFTRQPLTPEQERWGAEVGARTLHQNRPRNAWNLARSYLSRVPLSVERNRSAAMKRLVEGEVAEFSPQVIFVDGLVMAQYLPARFAGLKVLHEHNAEYQLWDRQAGEEAGPRGVAVSREAGRVRRYEASVLPRFDIVFAVSEEDRAALRDLGGDPDKLRVLPNIPDRSLLDRPAPRFTDTEPVVLYFATLSWQPNIEGIVRILALPLQQIARQVPGVTLVVAGKGASPELARRVRETPHAEFVGEVDDPEPLYRRARVMIDNSHTGGGTRLKILNALARGVPVVATPEAARGLDIVPGDHLIVARNEHMMIEAVVSLLGDADRWRILSENGRALVRAKYVPEVAFRSLDDVLARAATTL